jgi:hypothetical protein
MRVRITKALPAQLEGFDVSRFAIDGAYEINAPLCDVIIASGYGEPEDEPPADRQRAIKAFAEAITPDSAPDVPSRRRKTRARNRKR